MYDESIGNAESGERLKVILHQIESGEESVVVNYLEMNEMIEDVILAASGGEERIPCRSGETKYMLPVRSVLYMESVDRATFVYTKDGVYQTPCTLQNLELAYAGNGFFRCAKSMIINIYRVSELKSQSGGRIDAVMENGEHVIISRRYAKAFRRELRGEE